MSASERNSRVFKSLFKVREFESIFLILPRILPRILISQGRQKNNGHNLKTKLQYTVNFNVTALFPLIGAIIVYLAERRIKKDEDLVRSLDRIR